MLWIKPGGIGRARKGVTLQNRHTVVHVPGVILRVTEVGGGGKRRRIVVTDRVVSGRHISAAIGILDVDRGGRQGRTRYFRGLNRSFPT